MDCAGEPRRPVRKEKRDLLAAEEFAVLGRASSFEGREVWGSRGSVVLERGRFLMLRIWSS